MNCTVVIIGRICEAGHYGGNETQIHQDIPFIPGYFTQPSKYRALAIDSGQIAMAIADRDSAFLQSLPEIGKRTAETIIASLNGKVDHFATSGAFAQSTAKDTAAVDANDAGGAMNNSMAREALEVLMQLGENRAQTVNWINMALSDPDDRPTDVTALIERCFRIKAGA